MSTDTDAKTAAGAGADAGAEHHETAPVPFHPSNSNSNSNTDLTIDEKNNATATLAPAVNASASAALAAAVAANKPKLLSKNMLHLYFIMGIGYLVSTMNGFDSSLMGAINAMVPYQKSFNLSGSGSSTGLVFIIYNLGQIAAFPFCGLLADGYGRRVCISVGCAVVLVGTAVQGSAHAMGQFIAGRFVLGFGAALASAAGPAYTVELAHPAYRGTMAGSYNNFWWLGNIIAGWTTYGSNKNLTSSWAWRIPTLVQAGMPAIVMVLIMFFPESPRWLIAQDRREEALAVFAKYHGDGDENSPVVQLQYHEVIDQLHATRDDNPWWDFRELVNTRGARYRLYMVIGMSFIGQWSGNNVPTMIKNAGITDPNKQLLINAINPIFSLLGAVYGATLLDKLGRRFMMLAGLVGALFSYILLTAFTAASAEQLSLSYGVIVSIFLFGIVFAWGFTPLQTLYAVECLENRTRAKGSGLNFLFLNVAMVVNTYGISVGIEKIGWKLYLVYIGWIGVEMAIIYFFFVETAGKTLEEMASIFNAKNPRKESTKKTRIVEIDD
ncbi:lactose permease [Drepanopeziza brunnea f. sp. 'multigermtubi' MB_m1]|uniref:Lactose permease n=1 Tax=Marssonina brunnea f. sp. multigermtubi (strain MB_m1) TaxID=1072389 RepID=K1WNN1_MARBU|nr:lactose permease [Drepanopeziza brunnea f. sp. 'multigermtubi' MB_m1]EKD13962.1 lactose permease [Drepanopeziza brunnea f. sp. 'multigermtubi' MB_m1]